MHFWQFPWAHCAANTSFLLCLDRIQSQVSSYKYQYCRHRTTIWTDLSNSNSSRLISYFLFWFKLINQIFSRNDIWRYAMRWTHCMNQLCNNHHVKLPSFYNCRYFIVIIQYTSLGIECDERLLSILPSLHEAVYLVRYYLKVTGGPSDELCPCLATMYFITGKHNSYIDYCIHSA